MGRISFSNRWSYDMSIRSSRLAAVFASFVMLVAARAAVGQPSVTTLRPVQSKFLLPTPPSVGSDEYKAEIEEMLAIQATRTEAQIKQFRSQETLGLGAFKDIMPELASPDDLPKLKKLYKAMKDATTVPVDTGKDYFKRLRPFREDNRIEPLGARDQEYAYPSGHATRGYLYARILAQIDPDKKDALMERGRQIGWNRVMGGMHHPSDIAAGRTLGQAIARTLLRDADFKAQLDEVKEEYEEAKKDRTDVAAPSHAQ
jgi:acid phosphatase (class A)